MDCMFLYAADQIHMTFEDGKKQIFIMAQVLKP